jgi:hypothetical protein
MSQTPTFFSYGLEIMMFWVMQQLVEMEQIQLHLLGVAGVGFDATYDALVNTLTSGGAKVVANIPYVNTFRFHVIATNQYR